MPGDDPTGSGESIDVTTGAPSRWSAWRTARKQKKAARSRRRKWITRSAISLGVLVVVIVGAVFGYSLYRFGQIGRIAAPHVVKPTGPTENILLIGSTDRCSAQEIKQFKVECQVGVTGINSDVVLILHLNGTTHHASILSIPRDTFVPDARAGVGTDPPDRTVGLYDKIDAALANHPDQLVQAIEQDFGIPINHFIELNFNTFEDVVNALGGLHMFFPRRLVDDSSGLDVHHVGCLPFNGQEALELVRSRHLYWFTKNQTPNYAAIQAATNNGTYLTPDSGGQYDGTGDLGRIERVHLFLKALAGAVKARGLGNPFTDNALIGAVAPNLTVDETFSDTALFDLVSDFRSIDIDKTPELTAPVVIDSANYVYKGNPNYGDVVFPAEPQDQAAIDKFLGTAPVGWNLQPNSISVSVIDGTNSPSSTSSVASELGTLGYRVVATSESHYVGPVSETTVVYAPNHLAEAQRVEHSLSGTVVLGVGTPAAGAEISVVTGSILAVAHLVATPTTSTATTTSVGAAAAELTADATATTVLPKPTNANPSIGTPTSATPGITQFDPRSCPAKSS